MGLDEIESAVDGVTNLPSLVVMGSDLRLELDPAYLEQSHDVETAKREEPKGRKPSIFHRRGEAVS